MFTEVIMPKLGLTMEEGTVQAWRKSEGAPVQQGEMLLDIETDKTVVEVEAPATGYLRAILVGESSVVPVGTALAVITTTPDEPFERPGARAQSGAAAGVASPAATTGAPPAPPGDGSRVRASPAARRRARELNVDLANVKGTGPGGLIGAGDVESAAAGAAKSGAAALATASAGRIALTGMRRAIARALSLSHRTVPVFTLNRKVRADALLQAYRTKRAQLRESGGPEVTITDFLLQAVARTLSRHPEVNASFVGDPDSPDAHIVRHAAVNLGLAVATDAGLVVPVIADAGGLALEEISQRRRELVGRARAGRLRADESSGGTFSVSNLGGMGVDSFTAVINPPEAAILAVGRVVEEPVAEAGKIWIAQALSLTLSCDHRVIDGAMGAAFLLDLVKMLEQATDGK